MTRASGRRCGRLHLLARVWVAVDAVEANIDCADRQRRPDEIGAAQLATISWRSARTRRTTEQRSPLFSSRMTDGN
jgi:hypothetical protein